MTVQEQIIHIRPQKQSYEQGQQERQEQEKIEREQAMNQGKQSQDAFMMGMGNNSQDQSNALQNQQSFGGNQGNQGYGQDSSQGMQSYGQGQGQTFDNQQSLGRNQGYGQDPNQSYGQVQQGGMAGMGIQPGHHHQAGSLSRFGGRGKNEQRLICIPCHLNAESMHVVEWVNNNIVHPTDKVILVAVRDKIAPSISQTLPTNLVDVAEVHAVKEDEKCAEVLHKFTDLLPGIETEVKVLRGSYRSEILHYVNALQPNVCVVAEEHTTGLKKVFKGSTSEYLVHNLRVPVLVLPMRE